MSNCPYCSNQMLRHIRSHQVYWFCRHCWQEVIKSEITTEPRRDLSNISSISLARLWAIDS